MSDMYCLAPQSLLSLLS